MDIFIICTVKVKDLIQPESETVTVGDVAQFSCKTKQEVIWTFEGNNLPLEARTGKIHETNIHWMIIDNAELENEGTYTCATTIDGVVYESDGELYVLGNNRT